MGNLHTNNLCTLSLNMFSKYVKLSQSSRAFIFYSFQCAQLPNNFEIHTHNSLGGCIRRRMYTLWFPATTISNYSMVCSYPNALVQACWQFIFKFTFSFSYTTHAYTYSVHLGSLGCYIHFIMCALQELHIVHTLGNAFAGPVVDVEGTIYRLKFNAKSSEQTGIPAPKCRIDDRRFIICLP